MKKNLFAMFLVLLSCFYAGCQNKSELALSQVRTPIEQANQAFMDASLKADAGPVGALLTDDTLLLPPGGRIIRGKKAVEDYWRATWAVLKISDFKMKILDLSGKAGFVHEVGSYTLKFQIQGKEAVDEGKYVVVWRQLADGTWKKFIDIWNSDLPTQ
jgi:ketosteroid isomerase-like protein